MPVYLHAVLETVSNLKQQDHSIQSLSLHRARQLDLELSIRTVFEIKFVTIIKLTRLSYPGGVGRVATCFWRSKSNV